MALRRTPATPRTIEALRHEEAKRRNTPSAEYESLLDVASESPVQVAYERRNRDLDPQLVWRGKDEWLVASGECVVDSGAPARAPTYHLLGVNKMVEPVWGRLSAGFTHFPTTTPALLSCTLDSCRRRDP